MDGLDSSSCSLILQEYPYPAEYMEGGGSSSSFDSASDGDDGGPGFEEEYNYPEEYEVKSSFSRPTTPKPTTPKP